MTKRAVSVGENLWLTWNVRVIIVNMGDRVGCLAGNGLAEIEDLERKVVELLDELDTEVRVHQSQAPRIDPAA